MYIKTDVGLEVVINPDKPEDENADLDYVDNALGTSNSSCLFLWLCLELCADSILTEKNREIQAVAAPEEPSIDPIPMETEPMPSVNSDHLSSSNPIPTDPSRSKFRIL